MLTQYRDGPKDVEEYKLLNQKTKLMEAISNLEPDRLVGICLEQGLVIPGVWPALNIPNKWRNQTAHLKRFGNSRGQDYLKKVLNMKKLRGDNAPLTIPRSSIFWRSSKSFGVK